LQVLDRSALRQYSKVRLVSKTANDVISISEALEKAEALGMDLVLVSDQSDPPVVRVQDYNKLQFEKKKAKKEQIQKKSSLKEIQFKANISDHDFETKLGKIRDFLSRGDKVKIVVRLKGREKENPERATAIIDRVGVAVEAKISRVPGPMAIALLEPVKTKK
jgi:translation initiation factor IF-3